MVPPPSVKQLISINKISTFFFIMLNFRIDLSQEERNLYKKKNLIIVNLNVVLVVGCLIDNKISLLLKLLQYVKWVYHNRIQRRKNYIIKYLYIRYRTIVLILRD